MATEIIVPEEQPQELVESGTLWGTSEPSAVIAKATAVSRALMEVVHKQKLSIRISGREYLLVESWVLLGSMTGVFPVVIWTRPLKEDGVTVGWEARVEAVTRSGQVVGAAESMCQRSEPKWKDRDEFALRSMAQTRATSKALATCLRFIAVLAGFAGTPAEEMPREAPSTARWDGAHPPKTGKGSLCARCAALGLKSTTGNPPTFRMSKLGAWQCNGRTIELNDKGEQGWINHPMEPGPDEEAIVDDKPIPFA